MGYDTTLITSTIIPRVMSISKDDMNAMVMARALVLDTGRVLVCQKDETALTLHGAADNFLAYLEPNSHGTLQMKPLHGSKPIRASGSQDDSRVGYLNTDFELIYLDDDEQVKPLRWACSAQVRGMLVNFACGCQC